MVEATAFWVTAPGRGELRTEWLRPPGPGEALVETRFSGISRGTETLVFEGRVPASQHDAMRAPFQAGGFEFPLKYGYSSVGIVAGGAPELVGRRVFCLHPHQDRYVVPAAAVIPLPDAVPDARGVLAANLETAINGLWDAAPRVGDRAAVIGAGVVGALAAALLVRIPGCELQLIDVDPEKAAIAAALGVDFALPGAARGDLDLVVHASGRAEGLRTALGLAGFEARIVELSWYGDRDSQPAARRGVPQPAAAADLEPGRRGRARAAGPLEPLSPAEAGAGSARRPALRGAARPGGAVCPPARADGRAGRPSEQDHVPAHQLPITIGKRTCFGSPSGTTS